jgi:XisI protein
MNNKVKRYEKYILEILNDHKVGYQEYVWGHLEDVVLIDKNSLHYQLLTTGWQKGRHIHDISIHFHIAADGKIWVEINNTEVSVAKELEKKGVPKTDIVLGFHPEKVRHLTDYAVA